MYRSFLFFTVILLVAGACYSQAPPPAPAPSSEGETAAIKSVILDYIEGWYEGDPVRMERALHPELAKRGLMTIPATGKTAINPIGAQMMVEVTRAGTGKLPPDQRKIEVRVLDVDRNIAAAKAVSARFVDLIQLAKQDGRWRIVNVLWEPAPPPAK